MSNRKNVLFLAAALALAVTATSAPASAVQLGEGDYFVKLHYLLQPQFQLKYDPLSDDNGTPTAAPDFYIRRSRFILSGQVSKLVSFFMETDQANWGRGGTFDQPFYIQDAFVQFNIDPAFKIAMGMLLPPFSRAHRSSAVSLMAIDFHTKANKYPGGSHKTWRSMGVGVQGLLANDLIDYRVTITNGGATEDELPRFTGRLGVNFLDAEPGFAFGGTYLGKKKLFSLGLSFDYQPQVVEGDNDYWAVAFDAAWDLPFKGGNRLTGQAAFYYYGAIGEGAATVDQTAMAILFDLGYAIGDWQPMVVADWTKREDDDGLTGSYLGLHVACAYWLHGHNANIKLDVGLLKDHGQELGDAPIVTTVQTQLFF